MATIAFKWMEGENYNSLAKEYVDNSDFGSEDPTTKIYSFFSDLQRTISYEYAKYMRCYIEVLELVNSEADKPFLQSNAKLPPIHSYLEDGTCIPSQLSLIRSGLSRMSAIEVYKVLSPSIGQNLSLEEVPASIKRYAPVLKANLHPYFYQEVCKVFDIQ